MRTLPSALLAAQKSASAIPYVKVEIADNIGGIRRLDFDRLYEGSEPDGFHCATMPSDGSLNRFRVDPADNRLYRQRAPNPEDGGAENTFGKTGVGASSSSLGANTKTACRYTLAADAAIRTIRLHCQAVGGTGKAKAVIYADDSGAPGALLATSDELTGIDTSWAWRTFTFATPVDLTAGDYWLGVIWADSSYAWHYDAGSSQQRASNDDTYADGPSNPFGTVQAWADEAVSIYATYLDWSLWTDTGQTANAIACCSRQAHIKLFYIDNNSPYHVKYIDSFDSGQTWNPPQDPGFVSDANGRVAAAVAGDDDLVVIYTRGALVYARRHDGESWGSEISAGYSLSSVSGLAMCYEGDFDFLLTGVDNNSNDGLWSGIFGDGYSQAVDTWSPLREVAVASPGSAMEFRAPFLAYPDVFRLTFVEKYTGSESYSRPYFSFSPATADYVNNLWREPVPVNLTSDYGLAIAYSTGNVWLTTPSGVWQASLTTPALDVTADVLELTGETDPNGGRLRLVLRNDDGRYLDLTGEKGVIKAGGEVRVSPGYQTASGPLASSGPAYWIEGWEYTSGEGKASLVLNARDAWRLLEGWRSRRQYAWAQGERNVFQLLSFIMARAGLEFSSAGSSSVVTDLYPSFTIHPGESGATAVRRLLAMVPDVVFFRGQFAYIKNPQASEASDYSYGTEHAIFRGLYGSQRPQANRVQVFGDDLFVEAFGWDDIEDAYDRVRQVHDLNLDTVARAQDRADAEMRHQEIASSGGEIVVPLNCGQELYDVITITDQSAGLTDARRRVIGLSMRYSAGGRVPVYEQRLALGAV